MRNILIAILASTLAAGCLDAPAPASLPTCASLEAPDTLLCTRDGRCTWQGEACERAFEGSGSDTGSAASEPPTAPTEVTTCEALATDADPACFQACADFVGFMANVAPGTCREVACALTTGETKTIGGCVDGHQ